MPEAPAPARRTRRVDPDRKARIADAALEVIAEHGVAGTTHRRVAAAADVPLGSLTYHFDGMADLLCEAFGRHAERGAIDYAAHFASAGTPAELVDAVTEMVHAGAEDRRSWVVNYELYLAAQRDPALRAVTETWMRASRATLERLLHPETARGLDALLNGLLVQTGLSAAPVSRAQTRAAVARYLGERP